MTRRGRTDSFLLGAVVLSALIGILALAAFFLTGGKPPPAPATPPTPGGGQGAASAGAGAPGRGPGPPLPAGSSTLPGDAQPEVGSEKEQAFIDPQVVVRDLRDAAAAVRKQPDESSAVFENSVRALAAFWCRYDESQRRAANDAVLEFVFASSTWPQASARALGAVAGPAESLPVLSERLSADDVWPTIWSIGMLSRLARERDTAPDVGLRIRSALDSVLSSGGTPEPSFEAGAIAGLSRTVLPIVDGPSGGNRGVNEAALRTLRGTVEKWIAAAGALAGTDRAARDRLLADGLDRILRSSAEPDSDRLVFDAVQAIAAEISFADGSPARPWLLDWFSDDRISLADLRVVMSVVAGRSPASGVDRAMTLTIGATPDDRTRLKAELAKTWGAAGASSGEVTSSWIEEANGLLSAGTGSTAVEFLQATVRAALLNEAAALLWAGDQSGADAVLARAGPSAGLTFSTTSGAPPGTGVIRFTMSTGGAESGWAVRFRQADRNIPVRLERLKELSAFTPESLSGVDAEVLVETACFGSPAEVKLTAQDVVRRFASSPAILNGLLEQIPTAPQIRSVSAMLEDVTDRRLPDTRDDSWQIRARRALVERLIELGAGRGEFVGVDDLVAVLADAYAARLTGRFGPSRKPATRESAAAGALDCASLLCDQWLGDARSQVGLAGLPVSPDRVDRLRAGRRELAAGAVQEFAAEQVSGTEAMACVVCVERPARALAVSRLIDRMTRQRRDAASVFEQICATERAALSLWLIRFGQTVGTADQAGESP